MTVTNPLLVKRVTVEPLEVELREVLPVVVNERGFTQSAVVVGGDPAEIPLVPDAPTNFSVSYTAPNVTFSWDAVSGVDGYDVYVRVDSGAYAKANVSLITDLEFVKEYTDAGLYDAYVVAVLGEEVSAPSNIDSFEVEEAPTDFYTDFSEYTTGVIPSDWTRIWATEDTWTVVEVAGATGGKVLRYVGSTGNTSRKGLYWNAVGDAEDFEIYARFRLNGTVFTTTGALSNFGGRMSGALASENIVSGGIRRDQARTVQQILAGTLTTPANTSGTITSAAWYRIRVRVVGTDVQVRVWLDTDSEPGTWTVTATTTLTSAGKVGLMQFWRAVTFDVDWFEVKKL